MRGRLLLLLLVVKVAVVPCLPFVHRVSLSIHRRRHSTVECVNEKKGE